MTKITLNLSSAEAQALKDKLGWLMREANGVDIWLAPGGTLDVNSPEEGGTECFLDCDEEAHFRLGTILEKLGGTFTPHRDEGTFHQPLDVPGATAFVVYEVSQDGGVQISEPITGIYATKEAAVAEVKKRLENEEAKPFETDELGRDFYKAEPSLDVVVGQMKIG